jgi:hypothetical protein
MADRSCIARADAAADAGSAACHSARARIERRRAFDTIVLENGDAALHEKMRHVLRRRTIVNQPEDRGQAGDGRGKVPNAKRIASSGKN